jgi:hypothetical protein
MMIHDPVSHMNQLMTGMFWGGMLMSLPPVLLGIGIFALIYRNRRPRIAHGAAEARTDTDSL